jgi:hypothetical protein
MNTRALKLLALFALPVMILSLTLVISAQDAMEPSVTVSDQVVLDGSVTVDSVYYSEPSFIVIHADGGGGPGPVIGFRQLSPGENHNVKVWIDDSAATSTMYAMLHADTGEVGVYEFGTVEGADGPVRDSSDSVVTPAFSAAVMNVEDQFLDGDAYTAASVTQDVSGFLVIHADGGGGPGPVLGFTPIDAGTTANVTVSLEGDITDVLYPMLHVDTGEAGVYEFGTVEGADGPIIINGTVATTAIGTVPHVRVNNQIVSHGDAMEMMADMAPTLHAHSVLSEGPGFLVVHQEADGGPGPVAGFAAVEPGLNLEVNVELDPALLTGNLWPMLHVDTGEVGVYEFGTVEGADCPVRVNDQVLTFPVAAAPSINLEGVYLSDETTLIVNSALIDAPGWLAIHADGGGSPGPVIGAALLTPGWNGPIAVTIDPAGLTDTVFPMLHYDTGEAGVYEFGVVEGADGPVRFGEAVVVGPAEVDHSMMMEG